MMDVAKQFDGKISDLAMLLHRYPVVGMLLRVYATSPDDTPTVTFSKMAKIYNSELVAIGKDEIEMSFEIFENICRVAKEDWISLMTIFKTGYDIR